MYNHIYDGGGFIAKLIQSLYAGIQSLFKFRKKKKRYERNKKEINICGSWRLWWQKKGVTYTQKKKKKGLLRVSLWGRKFVLVEEDID